eukprot:4583346-Pyramimonas_sp.AAC.1
MLRNKRTDDRMDEFGKPEWEECNIPVCSTCDMFERGGKTDLVLPVAAAAAAVLVVGLALGAVYYVRK